MKKLFATILACALILSLTACGARGGADTSGSADGDAAASTYTAENPLVIKCGNSDSEDISTNIFLKEFKEYAESESEGRISVEIYPNSQLGDDAEMLKGVQMGTIQVVLTTGATATVAGDAAAMVNLPFVFDTYEDWREAWNGEALDLYNQALEKTGSGLYCLCAGFSGSYGLLSRDKCFETLEDLKGFKVRVTPTDINLEFWNNLGAAPTPMSFGDLYTGLNQGTVDGMDHSLALFYAAKFAEVAKYVTVTDHTFSVGECIVQKAWLDNLPEDLKEIVVTGLGQYAVRQDEILLAVDYAKALEEEFGCTVSYASDEMRAAMREACAGIYEKQREITGAEIIDAYLALGQK